MELICRAKFNSVIDESSVLMDVFKVDGTSIGLYPMNVFDGFNVEKVYNISFDKEICEITVNGEHHLPYWAKD